MSSFIQDALTITEDKLGEAYATIARLKAELAALKPKPVVTYQVIEVWTTASGIPNNRQIYSNCVFRGKYQLTFTDGKLTAATIIGDDNGKV